MAHQTVIVNDVTGFVSDSAGRYRMIVLVNYQTFKKWFSAHFIHLVLIIKRIQSQWIGFLLEVY